MEDNNAYQNADIATITPVLQPQSPQQPADIRGSSDDNPDIIVESNAATSTLTSTSATACKYCMSETDEPFRPCKCKMPIHRECLIEWLKTSKHNYCEVCNTQYNLQINRHFNVPNCCSCVWLSNWFSGREYQLMCILLHALVPFIGDNFSTLYTYTYNDGCAIVSSIPVPNLLTMGSQGYLMMMVFIIVTTCAQFTIGRAAMINEQYRGVMISIHIVFVLLWHVIVYIAGGLVALHMTLDVAGCTATPLDIERLDWLHHINISIVTWTIGSWVLMFIALAAVLVFIVVPCMVLSVFICGRHYIRKCFTNTTIVINEYKEIE